MGVSLVRYDAACHAISEAKRLDEVIDIRDKAEAMRAYAWQAKNKELEVDAAEIRIRAERRLGQILASLEKNKGAAGGGKKTAPRGSLVEPRDNSPTLSDLGIDKKLSARSQKLAALSDKEAEATVARWRAKATNNAGKVTVDMLKPDKKLHRAKREADLASKIEALPDRKYGVIVADPEWQWEPYSRETGMDRAAENHYPTSALDEIAARPVEGIAADDCVLFLWATVPMLPQALTVMAAWGFAYKSNIVWVKNKIGMGYWSRNKHELLLIGIRGNIPAPTPGTQSESAIKAPVGKHSAKPEIFLEIIEGYFPTLPKIELNRRGPARSGWDAWGNEVQP